MSDSFEPRDAASVCHRLLEVIPTSEEELLKDMEKYYNTLIHQAPEVRKTSICWLPLGNILNNNIPNIDHEWQKKVLRIFSNREN